MLRRNKSAWSFIQAASRFCEPRNCLNKAGQPMPGAKNLSALARHQRKAKIDMRSRRGFANDGAAQQ